MQRRRFIQRLAAVIMLPSMLRGMMQTPKAPKPITFTARDDTTLAELAEQAHRLGMRITLKLQPLQPLQPMNQKPIKLKPPYP